MAANAGSAFLQIMPTFKGNAKTIADLMDGKKAGSMAGGDAGDGFIGNFLKGVAQGIGQAAFNAVKNAAAAVVDGAKKLMVSAINEFADYEQQVGGIQTMFGAGGKTLEEYAASVGKTVDQARAKYADLTASEATMMRYAKEAFRTAGVSANEYMAQATSFSASLLQGLKGDTVKAAEYANKAMVDMSDNANKFGTNIGDIQHAYQGFAKQNWTMLDNLKLGYGGTKMEMGRLLADAQKLPGALGRKFDLSNYADIIEAIHLVQENLGITGTTALEAASTISGSLGMMKAAWTNLVTGLGSVGADYEWDLEGAAKNLTDSFSSVISNIGPAAASVVSQLPKLIKQLVTTFRTELWPQLKEQGANIIGAFMDGMADAFPSLAPKINAIKGLIRGNFSMMDEFGLDPKKIKHLFDQFQEIKTRISGFSFGNAFASIKETLEPVIAAITPLGQVLKGAAPALGEVGGAFRDIGSTLGGAIKELLPTLATAFSDLAKTAIPVLADTLPVVAKALKDVATPLINMVTPLLKNEKLVQGLILAFVGHKAISGAAGALNEFGNPLTKLATKITGLGTKADGPLGGLTGGFGAVKSAISGLKETGDGVAGFFNRFRDGFQNSGAAASSFSGVAGTLGGKVKIATTAIKGFTASMMANPVALIVAAVAALTVGLVYFFTKTETGRKAWAKFTEFLAASWVRIKEIAGKVKDFIIGIPATITGVWSNIKTFFIDLWATITDKVTTAFNAVKDVIVTAFHKVVDPILTIWSNIWGTIKAVLAGVFLTIVALITGNGNQIGEIWGRVGTKIFSIWSGVLDKLRQIWDQIEDTFFGAVYQVRQFLTDAWELIKNNVIEVWNSVVEFIKSIPARFMAGLAALGALAVRIGEWVNQAKTAVVNKFNDMVAWVKGVPGMWWAGIQDLANLAIRFGGWVTDTKNAVVTKFNEIVDWIKGIPGRVIAALANIGNDLVESGKNMMQGFINGITSKAAAVTSAVTNAVKGAVSGANNYLEVRSPSRLMKRMGGYVSEGLALGISDGAFGVSNCLVVRV